jgi:hypothetical protein
MNEKLFMEKANRLKSVITDWENWPINILNVGNIDGDPVQHGLFISQLDNDLTGLKIIHDVRVGRDYSRDDYFPDDFNGHLEEFIFDEGDSKITITYQNIGFNRNRELEKYSLFSNDSVVDFDEIYRRLDILTVETV